MASSHTIVDALAYAERVREDQVAGFPTVDVLEYIVLLADRIDALETRVTDAEMRDAALRIVLKGRVLLIREDPNEPHATTIGVWKGTGPEKPA